MIKIINSNEFIDEIKNIGYFNIVIYILEIMIDDYTKKSSKEGLETFMLLITLYYILLSLV